MTRRWLACVCVAGACMGAGCGSSRPYRLESTHDAAVRTIAVPIFDNTTYSTGIEASLTEAIVKEIQRATPWRVVRSDQAATTLRGTVVGADLGQLSRQRDTGLSQEQSVRLRVDFAWVDNRTGQTLVERRSFASEASFVPFRGVGEPLEVGEHGAIRELARDIVAELRADW